MERKSLESPLAKRTDENERFVRTKKSVLLAFSRVVKLQKGVTKHSRNISYRMQFCYNTFFKINIRYSAKTLKGVKQKHRL